MTVPPPKIDQRTYDDIVNQTIVLVESYTDWVRPATADAGLALIRIFGHMVKLVSDRINQVPEKNFLAFLNLIGTQLQPPQPARVPLTFTLTSDTVSDTVVPARTPVAAPAQEGETEEVTFETEQDLVVTPARLQAVFVREPRAKIETEGEEAFADRFSDYTVQAIQENTPAFPVFRAEKPIEHCLYLAADELLNRPGTKHLDLLFILIQEANLSGTEDGDTDTVFDEIGWSCWDGDSWQLLNVSPEDSRNGNLRFPSFPDFEDRMMINEQHHAWSLRITIPAENNLKTKEIDGVEAIWLRAKLLRPLPAGSSVLSKIVDMHAQISVNEREVKPDLCFFNSTPIDLSKDFYPFGEQPRFNDTFYIGSRQGFAKTSQWITLDFELSEGLVGQPSSDLEITWETYTENGWHKLDPTVVNTDVSINFSSNESGVRLPLPNNVTEGTVNGVTNYWIRARITKGNFGEPAKVIPGEPIKIGESENDIPTTQFQAATFAPPSIKSINLSYRRSDQGTIAHCRTYNDFVYTDPYPTVERTFTGAVSSRENQQVIWLSSTKGFAVGDRLRIPADAPADGDHDYEITTLYQDSPGIVLNRAFPESDLPAPGTRVFRYFPLFSPPVDQDPTLYLGFDRPLSNRPMTLYAQVAPLQPQEASHPQMVEQPAQVVWEYFNAGGWQPLGVRDETQTFVHRGLLQFIGPADMEARSDFGQPDLYWLRARWVDGDFKTPPRLQRLLTNTIWASQTQTLKNEILGSSDGNPNQTFQTTLSPVLRGQQLEVLENQLPSPQEQATLKRRLGADAITQEYDETGQPAAVWVRWLQVPDFHGSGPRDRHYILDHLTGVVQFGNGQQGLIPPLGRNTIRLRQYRTGGGEQGDRAANTITQLKTTVPFIDSVTNLEPAGGGAAQESIVQAQVRGPKQIRHRGRAVTAQDFEDLAFEASPDVARAYAVVPQFNPLEVPVPSDGGNLPSQTGSPQNQDDQATPGPLQTSQVKVLIVPSDTELQPVPSLGLMAQVERYLQQRCLPTLDVAVVGPEWVAVSVTAEVVPKTFETSDATRTAIMGQLDQFLHCLTGGRDGRGWGFGRRPHASDFYALIEAVEGVAWVPSLSFEVNPDPDEVETPFLIFPGQHAIQLVSPQGGR